MNYIGYRAVGIIVLFAFPAIFLAQETPSDFLDLKELIYTDPDKAIEAIQASFLKDPNPYYKFLEAQYFSYQCKNEAADSAYVKLLEQNLSEEFRTEVYLNHTLHFAQLGDQKKYRSMMDEIDPTQIDSTAKYYPAYLLARIRLKLSLQEELPLMEKFSYQFIDREHIPYRISSLVRLANLYREKMNQADLGMQTLHQADSLAQALNYPFGEGLSKFQLAIFYTLQAKYDDALHHLKTALTIREKIKDKNGVARCYSLLSSISLAIGDTLNALEYDSIALLHAEKYGLIRLKIRLLINSKSNDLNQNRKSYEKAMRLSKQINSMPNFGYAAFNLGSIFEHEENFEKASQLYQEAYRAFEDLELTANLAWLLPRISDLYLKWKEKKPEAYQLKYNDIQLEEMLNKSLEWGKTIEDYGHQKNVYESLIKLYDKRNKFHQSNTLRKEYIEIQKKIFEKERTDAASKYAAEFETAEKAKQIIQLESDKAIEVLKQSRLKWLLFVVCIFFALLAGLGYYVMGQRNLRKQALQRESFRSQLSSDLHDDVGTILSSVAMHSEILSQVSNEKTKASLNELARMSRDAMERMRDTVWAIDSRKDKIVDLQDRMVDYAEANLTSKQIQYVIKNQVVDRSKKINPELRQNLYLIFKEAITNIIKYSKAKQVTVSLTERPGQGYSLTIADNGRFDIEKIKTSGTGISNMKMRAEKFGGDLIIDLNSGFKITVANLKPGHLKN